MKDISMVVSRYRRAILQLTGRNLRQERCVASVRQVLGPSMVRWLGLYTQGRLPRTVDPPGRAVPAFDREIDRGLKPGSNRSDPSIRDRETGV